MSGTTIAITTPAQVKAIEKALGIDIPEAYEKKLVGGQLGIVDVKDDGTTYKEVSLATKKSSFEDGQKWEEMSVTTGGVEQSFNLHCDAAVCEGVIHVEVRPNTDTKANLFIDAVQPCRRNHILTANQSELRKALGLQQCK